VLIFTDQRKINIEIMENLSELMHQARIFLMQNQWFIPIQYVEDVALYGNIDTYVVACGVNINTAEGSHILNREAALYLVCRQLCDMGAGNHPFQPHPYMHDPVLIEEEEEEMVADVGAAMDPPGGNVPDQVVVDQHQDNGVHIQGPFFEQDPLLLPVVPAQILPVLVQPPEPEPKPEVKPKLEVKSEPNQGPTEYIEPIDDEYASLA
jgi:hypothetical protein